MWVMTEGMGRASWSWSHSSQGFRSKKSNLTARTPHQGMRWGPQLQLFRPQDFLPTQNHPHPPANKSVSVLLVKG